MSAETPPQGRVACRLVDHDPVREVGARMNGLSCPWPSRGARSTRSVSGSGRLMLDIGSPVWVDATAPEKVGDVQLETALACGSGEATAALGDEIGEPSSGVPRAFGEPSSFGLSCSWQAVVSSGLGRWPTQRS